MQFSLWKIVELSTKQQTLTHTGWWRHYWSDSRLSWDPKQYGGVSSIVLTPMDVWTPDVLVYSLIDIKHPGIESISISADGSCRWLSQRGISRRTTWSSAYSSLP